MSDKNFKNNLLYYLISNSQNEINDKNPISELITDYDEIIINGRDPNIFKLIYFNKKQINDIYYDSKEIINLDSIIIKNNLSSYFYLILLLKDNDDLFNYKYSLYFIRNLNAEINNNKNNIFLNIVRSKLIIELLNNYKQLDNYDDEEEEKDDEDELIKIENDNIININKRLNELKDLDLILDEDTIIKSNIDKIYIDIVKILIEKNKIDNYEILEQLDLKNINITKTMLDELSKILDNNKEI